MAHIQGIPRDQIILYPERLSDAIDPDDPVHLIDEYCRQVPYQKVGFANAVEAKTGRPGYAPSCLLALYLWGFMNGTTSSRRLERATKRSVDVMWLLERLRPDCKTISEFRRKNAEAITNLFGEFTEWMAGQDLVSGEMVAIDGSKFRASNGKDRNYTEKTLADKRKRNEARIREYLEQAEREDLADEQKEPGPVLTAEKIQEAIEKLRAKKDFFDDLVERMHKEQVNQISLTDPDSRRMKTNDGVNVCYNAQIVVDSKHNLIVAQRVTNDVNDEQQLQAMAKAAKDALGVETLTVLADGGYVNSTEIAACTADGITTYLPEKKVPQRKDGRFSKSDFRYDATNDTYICPAGKILTHATDGYDKKRLVHYYGTRECSRCPLRSRCTTDKQGRRIGRRDDESVLTDAALRSRGRADLMKKRKSMVEHPFGTIKRVINHGYFLLRGLPKVGAEFTLAAIAYDLKRILTLRPLLA
jgi:transposase